MSTVLVRTPAKINLALGVGPRRPDGFHDLASVYQAVGLYDEVEVSGASDVPAGDCDVIVEGPGAADVPLGRANLAVQAARLLADQTGLATGRGVRLRIRKGIPVAGGMAGGSSDAAATLVACNALWDAGLDLSDLLSLGARLGSDVPFCLLGGTAIGSGHGELVAPALARGSYDWVLAFGRGGLSTPAMYAALDRRRVADGPARDASDVPAPRVPAALLAALRTGDPSAVGRALTNDLEPMAIAARPALRRILDEGLDHGALGAIVSGSGPTCALLAKDADHAVDLTVRLSGTGLASSVVRAPGPVPGARIVDPTRPAEPE